MILVFDLDDTLYEEITYVRGALSAVADWLAEANGLNRNTVKADFLKVLKRDGRGQVFDTVLNKYELGTKANVRKCLSVYRASQPSIKLSKAGSDCLRRFKTWPLYLVTDGNKLVQSTKIELLGLDRFFKKTFPTHRYGVKHAKPSTFCFHRILKLEDAEPGDLVYIADNPKKDFVNLKKGGFKTVRVLTGPYKDLRVDESFDAHIAIANLSALTESFLEDLFQVTAHQERKQAHG